MRVSKSKQNFLLITVAGLLLTLALPVTALADKKGRGRRDFDKRSRKCDKFVNCHDARDGRWDGRGPRRDLDDWSLGSRGSRERRQRRWSRRDSDNRNRQYDTNPLYDVRDLKRRNGKKGR